ncbi:MAG: response regulator transcription factor [Pseudomonadota bacterium]
MSEYCVLVADDHPLYRDALSNLVSAAFDDVRVLESEDIATTLTQLTTGQIDLVLLDLSMPDAEGLDGLRRLRESSPATPVIICSAHDDPALVREAFQLGVSGYLPKSSGTEVTKHALQLVRSGGVYVPSQALMESVAQVAAQADETENDAREEGDTAGLTPRQLAVLALLEEGMSNKSIARQLNIGEITVKAHVSAILRKLKVDNRVQAVVAARALKR